MSIRILLIQNQISALQYFRQLIPHNALAKEFPDDIKVDRITNDTGESGIDGMSDKEISSYDIIYYLRQVSFEKGKVESTINRIHNLGCRAILDIDDYWILPKEHYYYKRYIENNVREEVERALRQVDYVITTTPYFESVIKEFTDNVSVFPNCIAEDEKQFTPAEIHNNRLRFGWIGGVFHREDILLMNKSFKKIWGYGEFSKYYDQWQICCGGFNPNPEYMIIENVLTNGYKFRHGDPDYYKFLMKGINMMEHYSFDKNYRRLWGRDIRNYADLYNHIDVALIPLKENKFNACKSELKIIEAGWMGKAVIVSDLFPYKNWIQNGFNGLTVLNNSQDWFIKIRKLVLDRDLVKTLATNLQKTIKENFDIKLWNKKRLNLYKELCQSE